MKPLLLACVLVATLAAQETPALRAAKHRFDLVAIRAAANFRSADSIDARLAEDGLVLHPRLAELRLRIQAGLGEARYEMDQKDYPAAEDALNRTEALVDRFARALGGN